jgi:hypothetical protein
MGPAVALIFAKAGSTGTKRSPMKCVAGQFEIAAV